MAAIRIVLADDHAILRDGVRGLLERDPALVVIGEADNGTGALHLAVALVPDVLILDLELPGLGGVEVARRLRAAGSPVRVLGLSAHDEAEHIGGLLAAGAAGYLLKGEAREAIVAAVRGVARGETGWLSPRAATKLHRSEGAVREIALTDRDRQLLAHLAAGLGNAEIAATLHLGEQTVRNYLSIMYEKIRVSSRTAAVRWARERELL